MLHYLFQYLESAYDLPGAGVVQYISFRAAFAVITSLIVSLLFGGKIISFIQNKQIGEEIRELGLEGEKQKKGTPTMGGLIIIAAILIPTILFADIFNIYIILMIISTLWLGLIGFIDDYIKVFKKDKEGLAGRFKIIGQVGLGLLVGLTLYFHEGITIKEKMDVPANTELVQSFGQEVKSTKTTIPFVKNNEFNYESLVGWLGDYSSSLSWIGFVLIVIFIVTAVSNGANMTDGLDGLATGTSAIIGVTLGILAYVSGNLFFADYLNIMYIPGSAELVIFMSAFVGACVGFLWYNSFPAQVFMGDTGSLALGGIIAVFAISIRKELLIPI
ncbi:phospho-N-acetylmuramoyl-pentapeptide-transferase, partial [Flavobacteriales bacterium]|nr:phospho-N-acetylmuramoyl-pentapeptide-transferase [Flavobacteriales bacterium]